MKLFFLSLIIITICISCNKNPVPVPNPSPASRVTRISSTPDDYQAFEYNAQGLITKYTAQWQNGTGTFNKITNTLEYNGSQLVKATNNVGYTLYTYQNNLPAKAENFFFNSKKISTMLFNFDQKNRLVYLIEQIAFPVQGGAEETKVSYHYYANGNLSRMDFAYRLQITDAFVVDFSKVFAEYDHKKNPEPAFVLGNYLTGVTLQINNPVKINNLDGDGILKGYNRYEYTYNNAGYPVRKKQIIAVGTVEQPPITFEYSY